MKAAVPRRSASAVTIVMMFAALGCRPEETSPPTAVAAPTQTQVILFQPPVPADVEEGGRCWTDSIAVNRAGAWRCMRENFIYDPCFAVAGQPRQVICGADPGQG